jgi:hypothetical protein
LKAIWVRRREERAAQINALIEQLDELNTPEAKIIAGALDYYGWNKGKLPHDDFVKLRKEIIEKAEDLISRSKA